MLSEQSQSRAVQIIVDHVSAHFNDVTPEKRWKEDLGMEWPDMAMMTELESEFGFTISEEEASKFVTVRDLYNYIEKNGKYK